MTDDFTGFPQVRGHGDAQAMLHRALARGQLHHALMFIGPRGVGKATLARGLACALLCPERPTIGCGRCGVCRRVLAGSHPDVDWLTPEGKGGQILIDAARACHVRQQSAPYEGPAYVIVIDPADALNDSSGNALLKAIEEPRPGVHFLLLSTNMQGVLPTILSRSLPVRLGRLSDADVDAIVGERAAEASAARRQTATLLAEGSAGVALELALDPALDRCLVLVREAMRAAQRGPAAIFAGDKSELWTAYSEAIQELAAVEAAAAAEAAEEAAAQSGKKRRKSSGDKGSSKQKETPAQQRWVASRLADLWILHLRERIRGRAGLPAVPALADPDPAELVRRIGVLQGFVGRVNRNANVRLMLEETLLALGEAPAAN